MKRPSKSGRVRPGQGLRLMWARALGVERLRDAAVAAGDRDRAHALHLELEAAAAGLSARIAADARAAREAKSAAAARPSDGLRAGRRLVVVDVPADRLDPAGDRPLSVPGGTLARPLWAVDMDPALKFVAATYAAWTEEVAAGGRPRALGHDVMRVDGGGAGASPETRLLFLAGRLAAAHRALDACRGLSALRSHAADRRVTLKARRLVDLVAVEGLSLCEVLRGAGWTATGRNKRTIRDLLVAALDAVAREWAGGRAPDRGGWVDTWRADGAELVVGASGTY